MPSPRSPLADAPSPATPNKPPPARSSSEVSTSASPGLRVEPAETRPNAAALGLESGRGLAPAGGGERPARLWLAQPKAWALRAGLRQTAHRFGRVEPRATDALAWCFAQPELASVLAVLDIDPASQRRAALHLARAEGPSSSSSSSSSRQALAGRHRPWAQAWLGAWVRARDRALASLYPWASSWAGFGVRPTDIALAILGDPERAAAWRAAGGLAPVWLRFADVHGTRPALAGLRLPPRRTPRETPSPGSPAARDLAQADPSVPQSAPLPLSGARAAAFSPPTFSSTTTATSPATLVAFADPLTPADELPALVAEALAPVPSRRGALSSDARNVAVRPVDLPFGASLPSTPTPLLEGPFGALVDRGARLQELAFARGWPLRLEVLPDRSPPPSPPASFG